MIKYLAKKSEDYANFITRLYGVDQQAATITFQVTENCCMACSYCYQHNKSTKSMPFETAKVVIDKLLNDELDIKKENTKAIVFDFIGGEPLMEIDLIEEILIYFLDQATQKNHPWANYFIFSIGSNGILYETPKVQRFFDKYHNFCSFGVSIDGNKELHDACRVDLEGKGTYDRAISALLDYNSKYSKDMSTKMTLSPFNISYLYDATINMINIGFTEINLNCVFEEGWNLSHAQIMYKELKKVADYLIDNELYSKIYYRLFEEDQYQPLNEEDNQNWCGGVCENNCFTHFAVDKDGDLYPCIRYMDSSLNGKQPPLKIGSIFEGIGATTEMKNNINLISNITRKSQSTEECFNCPIAAGCSWCSAYNYEQFGTPNKRATNICCMHKAASLANVYYWNKIYSKNNIDKVFKLYLPKESELEIIDEKEYNFLLSLTQGGENK